MPILSLYRWVIDRNVSVCFKGIHPERFISKRKSGLHEFYPCFWHPVFMYLVIISMCLFSKEKRIQGLIFLFLCRENGVQHETRDTQLGRGPWAWMRLQWSYYPALILTEAVTVMIASDCRFK